MMSPCIRPGDLPPFHNLGEYVFQDLCRDLLDAEPDIATCEVYGERGQRQDGIDLRAYCKESNGIVVGQCKCYQDFPPAEIRQASEEGIGKTPIRRLLSRGKTSPLHTLLHFLPRYVAWHLAADLPFRPHPCLQRL